jgi:hypothetical protein
LDPQKVGKQSPSNKKKYGQNHLPNIKVSQKFNLFNTFRLAKRKYIIQIISEHA